MTVELTLSLQEHLARTAMLHTRLCPRQVLGVRMARFACQWLGIDPAIRRKQIFVFMEIGGCAADGVVMVTGASPTNSLMKLIPYGKIAATFVDLKTNRAVRVSEHHDCRRTAQQMRSDLNPWQAQLEAYQIMPDYCLLTWQEVIPTENIPLTTRKFSVLCDRCGDKINEHCEVVIDSTTYCKPCAFGAYFQPVQEIEAACVP